MANIRLTKEFSFEMSHALEGYDGGCRHIHGHSYKLFVTIIGTPICDNSNPKNGMVMDFGELKRIVNKTVTERYDHCFVIRLTQSNSSLVHDMKEHYGKVEIVDYQPTCENMITRFTEDIAALLPKGVELFSLKLHETATSYAEWHRSDNI